jgi:NTP pyrophosphatase (non-canonical NTP hydrolase)
LSASDPLSLDAYQQAALRTANPALSMNDRMMDGAAGLAEEAGEVLGHVRKHVMQQRDLDRDAVVRELGDALWCLAVVASSVGVSLSEVARMNEEKLRERYPKGFAGTT